MTLTDSTDLRIELTLPDDLDRAVVTARVHACARRETLWLRDRDGITHRVEPRVLIDVEAIRARPEGQGQDPTLSLDVRITIGSWCHLGEAMLALRADGKVDQRGTRPEDWLDPGLVGAARRLSQAGAAEVLS